MTLTRPDLVRAGFTIIEHFIAEKAFRSNLSIGFFLVINVDFEYIRKFYELTNEYIESHLVGIDYQTSLR